MNNEHLPDRNVKGLAETIKSDLKLLSSWWEHCTKRQIKKGAIGYCHMVKVRRNGSKASVLSRIFTDIGVEGWG